MGVAASAVEGEYLGSVEGAAAAAAADALQASYYTTRTADRIATRPTPSTPTVPPLPPSVQSTPAKTPTHGRRDELRLQLIEGSVQSILNALWHVSLRNSFVRSGCERTWWPSKVNGLVCT